MANFPPLKNYIFYCLDTIIREEKCEGPFLDVGCGSGDVSEHLAKSGWSGKAIDISDIAYANASKLLKPFASVLVTQEPLDKVKENYSTVLFMDILEHVDDDISLLKLANEALNENGSVIISVPSNPVEWRWDDDYYGHVRRYTKDELETKLRQSGFEPILMWDFTFPLFWAMRRVYTFLKKAPKIEEGKSALDLTVESSAQNAWEIPFLSNLLSKDFFIWQWIYNWQFKNYKDKLEKGHEMIVLARKITT